MKQRLFNFLILLIFGQSIFCQNVKYSGRVEAGMNYNSIVSLYSPYPATYYYIRSNQKLEIFSVPFDINLQLTNLNAAFVTKNFYPNLISISYNQEKLRQNLQKKAMQKLEKEYENILLSKQKQNENAKLIELIDSIQKSMPDSNELEFQKNAALQMINKNDTMALKELLDNYEKEKAFRKKLLELKENAIKENSSMKINDSVINTYNQLKDKRMEINEIKSILPLNKFENFMSKIERFNTGRFFWNKEERFVSNGVTVDGLEVNTKFGKFEAGAISGRLFPVIFWNQFGGWWNGSMQIINGGNIGMRSKNHLVKISGYSFSGKDKELFKRNNQIGTVSYKFIGEKLEYELNAAGSQAFTENINTNYYYQGLPVIENFSADNIIGNILQQKNNFGTQTGYAFHSAMKLKFKKVLKETGIQYEQISPFYFSSAAPFLMKDQQYVELKNQMYITKKIEINLSGYYRQDNLSGLKTVTTYWKSIQFRQRWKINEHFRMNINYRYINRMSNQLTEQHQISYSGEYIRNRNGLKNLFLQLNSYESETLPMVRNAILQGFFDWNNKWRFTANVQYLEFRDLKLDQKYKENYTFQSGIGYNNKWLEINLNGFLFYKYDGLWNRGIDVSGNIQVIKNFNIRFLAGYGQNRSIWNEANVISINNSNILNNEYFYSNFALIFNW
ncbi:MAG TPA: hypothetical protein PK995_08030 [Bacteroidia bacterium]|nr:hypothetical protein [Bacteroidia bacterium]